MNCTEAVQVVNSHVLLFALSSFTLGTDLLTFHIGYCTWYGLTHGI